MSKFYFVVTEYYKRYGLASYRCRVVALEPGWDILSVIKSDETEYDTEIYECWIMESKEAAEEFAKRNNDQFEEAAKHMA